MDVEAQIFGTVVSLFVLCMLCVCGLDIRNFWRKNTIITGRQLCVRLFGGAFIIALLIKLIYGIYWVNHEVQGSDYFINYWAKCVALAYLCLAFAVYEMVFTSRLRKHALGVNSRIAKRLNQIYRAYLPNSKNAETSSSLDPKSE